MRQFIINSIDNLVLGLVKLRYRFYLHGLTISESSEILERWKKIYPSTFDMSKSVAPLNPVTTDLVEASKKEIPVEELDKVFPPQESVNYSGH